MFSLSMRRTHNSVSLHLNAKPKLHLLKVITERKKKDTFTLRGKSKKKHRFLLAYFIKIYL